MWVLGKKTMYAPVTAAMEPDAPMTLALSNAVWSARRDAADEEEGGVADLAEAVFYVGAEDPEEEHVAGEVEEVGVEELVGDEVPPGEIGRSEHARSDELLAGVRILDRELRHERGDARRDEDVVDQCWLAEGAVCAEGQEHD